MPAKAGPADTSWADGRRGRWIGVRHTHASLSRAESGIEAMAVLADAACRGQGACCSGACSLYGVGGAQGVHWALVAMVHEAGPLRPFAA